MHRAFISGLAHTLWHEHRQSKFLSKRMQIILQPTVKIFCQKNAKCIQVCSCILSSSDHIHSNIIIGKFKMNKDITYGWLNTFDW